MVKWRGFIDSVLSFRQRGLHDEQAFQAVNYVSASRSSENLQFYMDRKVEQNKDKLPEKVKSYITNETREIPMWEEFKVCPQTQLAKPEKRQKKKAPEKQEHKNFAVFFPREQAPP